jgi:phosphoglycolate phosphatase
MNRPIGNRQSPMDVDTRQPTLLLFDIDGTLLLTGRAGLRAMVGAFEALFGVPNAFEGVLMGGRTDSWLVSDALARWGLADP